MAVKDDKKKPYGVVHTFTSTGAQSLQQGDGSFTNILGYYKVFVDDGDNPDVEIAPRVIYGTALPSTFGQDDYKSLSVGSLYFQFTLTNSVPSAFALYVKDTPTTWKRASLV